jgi:threonine dehydratase
MKKTDYLERILSARVYDVAIKTPLDPAPSLSARLGNRLHLKREDLQQVFSFKLRGAYNKMARLPAASLKRGVIAASAGNHAQGVALAAEKLNCTATIVMPVTTPQIKIAAVKARGAKVIMQGDGYDEAYAHAKVLARKRRLTFVHPYDDPDVIAGQGTIAMEILSQHPRPIHAVFVAIGGGRSDFRASRPYVKRLAARDQGDRRGAHGCGCDVSLAQGRPAREARPGGDSSPTGVAVKQVGLETFRLCRELLDDVILVDTDEICAAIKDVFEGCAGGAGAGGGPRHCGREGLQSRAPGSATRRSSRSPPELT